MKVTALLSTVTILINNLIKICNDLIEEAETLGSLVIHGHFHVKLVEVWDGCKHHPNAVVALVIQVLKHRLLHCHKNANTARVNTKVGADYYTYEKI